MYHIVSFVDTEEVDVVPAIWVKSGVCLWPPYKSERVQMAAKCWEQPQESWSSYKVKVMDTASMCKSFLYTLCLIKKVKWETTFWIVLIF